MDGLPRFYYREHPLGDKVVNYALLSWTLDGTVCLGDTENTGGYQLSHINAKFDCQTESVGDVVKILITGFTELEVESNDPDSDLDESFYLFHIKDKNNLDIQARDFKEVFERAVAARNKEAIETNKLNPLSDPLKTIDISIS